MNPRIRASLVSIGADLLLISVKGFLAFLSGSAALLADAYHSLSDLFVSVAVLTGAFFRGRLEQRSIPAGESVDPVEPLVAPKDAVKTDRPSDGEYDKHETATAKKGYWIDAGIAYGISLVILYLPYEIISGLGNAKPTDPRYAWAAILGVIVCIVLAYFLSRFKILAGTKHDSPALIADGQHSRMDMFTSIAVLVSLLGQGIGLELDSLVAVVIAVMIGIVGLELFITSIMAFIKKGDLRRLSLFPWLQERATAFLVWVIHRLTGRVVNVAESGLWDRFSLRRLLAPKRLAVVGTFLLVLYVLTGFSMIRPDETGVRLRLGRIVESDLGPGLTFGLPWPIETLRRVRKDEIRRVELGFRTSTELQGSFSPLLWEATHQVAGYKKREEESIALTGDENILDASLVLHYRLSDPLTATFRVNDVSSVLRGLLESALRRVLATETTDRILVEDRKGILSALQREVQQASDRLNLGVEVLEVFCHDLHPPMDVVSAFRDVFSAREEKTTLLNKAETYRNTSLPKARSDSLQRQQGAHAESAERKDKALGDAQRFALTAAAFHLYPDVTAFRMYMEMAEQSLSGRRKIIADPDANRGGYRLWLFAPEGNEGFPGSRTGNGNAGKEQP